MPLRRMSRHYLALRGDQENDSGSDTGPSATALVVPGLHREESFLTYMDDMSIDQKLVADKNKNEKMLTDEDLAKMLSEYPDEEAAASTASASARKASAASTASKAPAAEKEVKKEVKGFCDKHPDCLLKPKPGTAGHHGRCVWIDPDDGERRWLPKGEVERYAAQMAAQAKPPAKPSAKPPAKAPDPPKAAGKRKAEAPPSLAAAMAKAAKASAAVEAAAAAAAAAEKQAKKDVYRAAEAEKQRLREVAQAKEYKIVRMKLLLEKNRRDAVKEAERVAQAQAEAAAAAEAAIAQEEQEAGEALRMADCLSQEYIDPSLMEE